MDASMHSKIIFLLTRQIWSLTKNPEMLIISKGDLIVESSINDNSKSVINAVGFLKEKSANKIIINRLIDGAKVMWDDCKFIKVPIKLGRTNE